MRNLVFCLTNLVAFCFFVNGSMVETPTIIDNSSVKENTSIVEQVAVDNKSIEDDELIRSETYRMAGQTLSSAKYFSDPVQPSPDNRMVWERVIAGNGNDPSILAVGYENIKTQYGDEGTSIFHNTPTCSRIAFLSGGMRGYYAGKSMNDRVSAEKYNHIYVDFLKLREDVPYMLNSHFFDYIIVGADTFRYMTRKSTVLHFVSMLSEEGTMILPLNYDDYTYQSLDEIFSGFSITTYLKDRKYKLSRFDAEVLERMQKRGKTLSDQERFSKMQANVELGNRAECLSEHYKLKESKFPIRYLEGGGSSIPVYDESKDESDVLFANLKSVHPFVKSCFDDLLPAKGYAAISHSSKE